MAYSLSDIVQELRHRKGDPPAGRVVGPDIHEWCPFHADGNGSAPHAPSLRINREKEVWFCDPCDEGGTLSDLAQRLSMATNGQKPPGRTYDYHDAEGRLWGQVVRKAGKDFKRRRPDGSGGWIWNWKGITPTLYRLPELLTGDPEKWAFVVEGEKDADRLAHLGQAATTNAGGAGKWRPELSAPLIGRKVAIIPDNDEPGRAHAQNVVQSLANKAAEVRILDLGLTDAGADVSDWLDQGGTIKELLEITEKATNSRILANAPTPYVSQWRPAFSPVNAEILARSEQEQTTWILHNYIPAGGLDLLAAQPKCGKSTFAYHLARAVSTGADFIGQTTNPCPVLILALEERKQDVANRCRSLRLSTDVHIHCAPLRTDSVSDIATFVLKEKIGLVIVDTLPRFWLLENENDAAQVGAAMANILALARDTGAAVLLLYHVRKSPGQDGNEIRGSGDIFAHVDVALVMRRRDHGERNQRVITAFSRYDTTPDEVVIALEDDEYKSLGSTTELRQTELTEQLLDALNDEPRTPSEIKDATELPQAPRTLRRHYAEMFAKGLCDREGTGQKTLPFKYKMLAATPNSRVATHWPESTDRKCTDCGLTLSVIAVGDRCGRCSSKGQNNP
ncbi:MAG: hypothetical protein E6J43_01955 [Chloroflexi bacterium]|nr:MAG: hypothetical protein E6J43_01955 [Chloroflexota bacterium]